MRIAMTAVKEIFHQININQIKEFIDEISYISEGRKAFYLNIIEQRYNIIKTVYKSLTKCNI